MKLDKTCDGAHAKVRMKQDAGNKRTVITEVSADSVEKLLGDSPSYSDDSEGFCILSTDTKYRFETKCFNDAEVQALKLKDGVKEPRGKRDGK